MCTDSIHPLWIQIPLYFLYAHLHLYVSSLVTSKASPTGISLCDAPPLLFAVYALSSLHYTIVGVAFWRYFALPSSYYQSFYPLFLTIQGPVSYLSDITYTDRTQEHWSHKLDRTFASYNMLVGVCMLWQCFSHNIPELGCILLGTAIKKADDYCFVRKRTQAYMVFHMLWHTILPVYGVYKAATHTSLSRL